MFTYPAENWMRGVYGMWEDGWTNEFLRFDIITRAEAKSECDFERRVEANKKEYGRWMEEGEGGEGGERGEDQCLIKCISVSKLAECSLLIWIWWAHSSIHSFIHSFIPPQPQPQSQLIQKRLLLHHDGASMESPVVGIKLDLG